MKEANLQYANMEGSTGLLGNEFSQADVTITKLPEDIKEFKALEVVEKTSQNARKMGLFLVYIVNCQALSVVRSQFPVPSSQKDSLCPKYQCKYLLNENLNRIIIALGNSL